MLKRGDELSLLATSLIGDKLSVREEDAIRLVLEFLSKRDLCLSQLSLERESGVNNCAYGDDLIFLRQLILDGQWEDALQFVQPLEYFDTFPVDQFRFVIYKHKYIELLCIRSESSESAPNGVRFQTEIAIQDIIDCLKHLECCAPVPEDYNRLNGLLTVDDLSQEPELRNWNPSQWRLKCFQEIVPLVRVFLDSDNSDQQQSKSNKKSISTNDRLMKLIFKGLMYEVTLNIIQSKLQPQNASSTRPPIEVLTGVKGEADSAGSDDFKFNLTGFLEQLSPDLLTQYFLTGNLPEIHLDIEKHAKPDLVASWSEMILAQPIKPKVFPHNAVPYTRIRPADLMSKSLSTSLLGAGSGRGGSQGAGTGGGGGLMTMSIADIAHFSRSTLAQSGFRLKQQQQQTPISTHDNNNTEMSAMTREEEDNDANAAGPINIMTASMERLFQGNEVFSTSSNLPTIIETQTPSTPEKTFFATIAENDAAENGADQSVTLDTEPNRMESSYIDIWKQQQRKTKTALKSSPQPSASTSHRIAASNTAHHPVTTVPRATPPSEDMSGRVEVTKRTSNTVRKVDSFRRSLSRPSSIIVAQDVQLTASEQSSTATTPSSNEQRSVKLDKHHDEAISLVDPTPATTFTGRIVPLVKHGARAGNQSPTLNMTSTSASTRGVVSGVAGATIHESPSTFDLIDEENAVKFVSTCRVTDSEAVRAVDWHPSGQFFAVGSNSKLLRVFRVGGSAAAGSTTQDSNNNVTNSFETPPEVIYRRPRYHKGSVYCLSWNKLGNLLATGSNDKCIKLASFNASSGTFEDCESIISAHDGTVRDLCFMDDLTNGSSVLLSAGAGNCRIYVTDCETATSFLSLSGHSRPIHTLYTWGGATLVSGSEDRTIRMWDLRSRDCYNLISCPTISRNKSGGAVTAVAVDPSGRLLVSGHEDSTCMLYDIRAGRVIQTFQPHTADVRTIRFSSKAYYLLTGGFDSRLVLSNLQGDLTQPIQSVEVARHDDKVISARWHPTDFSFLTASADKTAALWSLQDNTPILSG